MPSFDYQGGWENDETIREAACREAFEEAGVKGILSVCSFYVLSTGLIDIICVEIFVYILESYDPCSEFCPHAYLLAYDMHMDL